MEKNYKISFNEQSFNSIKLNKKFLLQKIKEFKKENEFMENQRNIFRR